MHENEISGHIVNAAITVHRTLGPGLLESIYEKALLIELRDHKKLEVKQQVQISAAYRGHDLGLAYRADLIVENKVIIELKSVAQIHPVHAKQLLTYLRLADLKLGLLINFNEVLVKDGITRVVNGL